MNLVSMKREPNEAAEAAITGDNPYGYGLVLRLDDDQCEALGIKSPPAPGAVYMVHARAFVQSVAIEAEETSEVAAEGNKPDVTMSLQITDMSIDPQGRSAADVAASLYG